MVKYSFVAIKSLVFTVELSALKSKNEIFSLTSENLSALAELEISVPEIRGGSRIFWRRRADFQNEY